MIDLHSHLDLYPNALDICDKANNFNKFTLAVTTSPKAWLITSGILKKYNNIKVGLGLHPQIFDKKKDEQDLFFDLIGKTNFIGEIGIDGYSKRSCLLNSQKIFFEKALKLCEEYGGRIISIHSRFAASEVLSILKKYPNCGIPILHWFSGSSSELEKAIEMECFFSVNPLMINSKNGKYLVSKIPPKLILPESDGPFATLKGKPILPWEAMNICHFLGDIWNVSNFEANQIVLDNAKRIINFR